MHNKLESVYNFCPSNLENLKRYPVKQLKRYTEIQLEDVHNSIGFVMAAIWKQLRGIIKKYIWIHRQYHTALKIML